VTSLSARRGDGDDSDRPDRRRGRSTDRSSRAQIRQHHVQRGVPHRRTTVQATVTTTAVAAATATF